jgi:hypothetical protein
MNLRWAGLGALWILTSCLTTPGVSDLGTTSGGSGTGSPGWVGELQAESAPAAAYSIVDDEQGPYFAIVDIVGSSSGAATCSEQLGAASTQVPLGKWTLELATPALPGQYAVLSAQADPIYPNLGPNLGGAGSVVRLVLLDSATSASQFYPVSGSVTVTSGPSTVSQELGGQHLTGSYHLGFAAEPLQGNCSYGTAFYDLGDQVISTDYVCSCITPEGMQVSTCDGGGGNFSGCCYQDVPAAITVDGTFDATACPGLCVAPLGLTKACHPLQPDGGTG